MTDVKRQEPGKGTVVGNKVQIAVKFDKAMFGIMQDMATDRGSSFAAMNRALVGYGLDELSLANGGNRIASDEETESDV